MVTANSKTTDEGRNVMSRIACHTPRRTTALAALLTLVAVAGAAACSSASSSSAQSSAASGTTSPGTGSSATASSGTAGQPLKQLRIALDWTPNVDFLGIYAAISNGYFTKEGIQPVIIPYSGTPGETLLSTGKADLAFTYPPNIPAYRASGLKYRAVAGLAAVNTIDIAVLKSSPYTSPAQLSGQLYGGFGVPSDPPILKAVMAKAGATNPVYKEVVLSTSAYQALASKRVAYSVMFGGVDDVTAELQGAQLRLFPIRNYLGAAASFPDDSLAATDAEIADNASVLRAGLAALSQGYIWSAAHPAQAEQILINDNASALAHSKNIIVATGNATAPTFLDSAGQWGSLSDASFTGVTQLMAQGGLFKGKTPPPASDDYTNSLLPQG
jgi:ABC-type nitrate/sulfonate/bicarbonate transport system substrate-binding protein